MKKLKYLLNLRTDNVVVKSAKINSILKIAKIGIPTVPDPFSMDTSVYNYYQKNKQLPQDFLKELGKFLEWKRSKNTTLSYRPSVFSPAEKGLDLCIKNKVNIIEFDKVKEAIITSFDSIINAAKKPDKVEFSALVHTFYDSDRCGLLHTSDNDGRIYVEAIFGQHTNLLTREGAEYDTYCIDKKSLRVVEKNIAKKTTTLVKLKSGLIHKKLDKKDVMKPVLNENQIKQLASYAIRLENKYGPQEVEWAVLASGELIFQGARDLKVERFKVDAKIKTIYPGDIEGLVAIARNNDDLKQLDEKILVTDNLNVGFIMKAISKQRPVGVILTKGSIMSHAATLLREMKVPSFLIENLKVKNQEKIKLENGIIKRK